MMQKGGAVYILTNTRNTVLYTGVTNDLFRRVSEHRDGLNPHAFTSKYNLNRLVYYERFHSIEEAINREKQIKGKSRKKKEELINSINPKWKDLWDEIKEW
ncbi:GIY-YIG nuclease family protein [Algoriphagus machipongonensis]|uniref:GIY-YIG catalytic domain protein n=1 Tax=Algoriphagus machipongonensis TaxID=388413 RepID=A3HZY6_9BACT|nr:GIY-YIG nuclease family protein [Algoriphagus machipongonensis]EAZ80822.1 GIY-YIG catalytic domain protein [Algoriphagus machipongonensis]